MSHHRAPSTSQKHPSRHSSSVQNSVHDVSEAAQTAESIEEQDEEEEVMFETEPVPEEDEIVDETTMVGLERSFQKVIDEMANREEAGIDVFRLEYEKLYRALMKAQNSERVLLEKIYRMNGEIASHVTKVQHVLKLAQEDQAHVTRLKQELETAWLQIDRANNAEWLAAKNTSALQEEVRKLEELLVDSAKFSDAQRKTFNEVAAVKDAMTVEMEQKRREIAELREKLEVAENHDKTELVALEAMRLKVEKLELSVQAAMNETRREMLLRDKTESELNAAGEEIELRGYEIERLLSTNKKLNKQIDKMEKSQHECRGRLHNSEKELEELRMRFTQTQMHSAGLDNYIERLQQQIHDLNIAVQSYERAVREAQTEVENISTKNETLVDKIAKMTRERHDLQSVIEVTANELTVTKNELKREKKQTAEDAETMKQMRKETEVLAKNLKTQQDHGDQCENKIKLLESEIQSEKTSIKNREAELAKRRGDIEQLQKEKDKQTKIANKHYRQAEVLRELIKRLELEITDGRNKQLDTEASLKKTKEMFEKIRDSRNICGKKMLKARDDISDFEQVLKLKQHQVAQISEEGMYKDGEILKERFEKQMMENERDLLKAELSKFKLQGDEAKSILDTLEYEKKMLTRQVNKIEEDMRLAKLENNKIQSERDLLGTQLVRRNDEIALLYEKIRMMQLMLDRGENMYDERLEDIRILKLEIRNITDTKNIIFKDVENITILRREFTNTERELMQARQRIRFLEMELSKPSNIHRWRTLGGVNPSQFELIMKVQTVQKRLIMKTEEVVQKELQLQTKDQMYAELKRRMLRLPGEKVVNQLTAFKRNVLKKNKLLKAAVAERNMNEAEKSLGKMENEGLRRELEILKSKHLKLKKQKFYELQEERERQQSFPPVTGTNRNERIVN